MIANLALKYKINIVINYKKFIDMKDVNHYILFSDKIQYDKFGLYDYFPGYKGYLDQSFDLSELENVLIKLQKLKVFT